MNPTDCHCERHPHAKGTIIARPADINLIDPDCRFHGEYTMTTIPGWTDPLSVTPDERPAVTAANLAAIQRHKERATADRQHMESR